MNSAKVKTNRRKARRFSLSSKVTYEISAQQPSPLPARQAGASKEVGRGAAQLLNVSDGGICLATREALRTAQIIKIDFPLIMIGSTVPTLADVLWVSRGSGKADHQ